MSFSFNPQSRLRVCKLSDKQSVQTISDLAITPSIMADMVDKGIPVSSQALSGQYFDGVENPNWDLPIDQKRGVDVAEVWNAQLDSRQNVRSHIVSKPADHV